ncbi:hypothetical protein BC830DRAFT_1114090 [Chytriomyces sp. MP71]|nr:hypothetical protein BC830DRAFT_1114090 [Chytriomyces sp. MP71]
MMGTVDNVYEEDEDMDALDALRESEQDEVRENADREKHIFTTKYASKADERHRECTVIASAATPSNPAFSSSPPGFTSPALRKVALVKLDPHLDDMVEEESVFGREGADDILPRWMNAYAEVKVVGKDSRDRPGPADTMDSQESGALGFGENSDSDDDDDDADGADKVPQEKVLLAHKQLLEDALEMEMFGASKPRVEDNLDIPDKAEYERNIEEDDDGGALFSDGDDDDAPLAEEMGQEPYPPAKRRYHPISMSDGEGDASEDEATSRGRRVQPMQPSIEEVNKFAFYGDRELTEAELGMGPPKLPPRRRSHSPVVEYDEDGEPVFMYPDSSDDEAPRAKGSAAPQAGMHREEGPNDPARAHLRENLNDAGDTTAPRLFRHDHPPQTAFTLPYGGRRKAPSKAEVEARRVKELRVVAQRMKLEKEARAAGLEEEVGRDSGKGGRPWSRDANYLLMPADGRAWRTAMDSKGRRLYFPVKRYRDLLSLRGEGAGKRVDLLGESVHVLLRRLEEEIAREGDDVAARAAVAGMVGEEEARALLSSSNDRMGGHENAVVTSKLWVDKYTPRMYVDLIGDERINREVLTWVKQWDHCVFKKPIKKNMANKAGGIGQPGWMKSQIADPWHRPDKKILLLSGPAGLGKTTLAHIVGRHAGYNVIEINASDDRTGESLRNKLMGAIESQSLKSKKPNIIVIDEIDGASAGGGEDSFMELLVNLATGTLKQREGSGGGGVDGVFEENGLVNKKAIKRAASKSRVLLRPIICICNDQYAPVLRPLRPIAQAYTFKPPAHRILANRLTEICRMEGLQTDLRTLMALCELTDGDIRSSLNTLQFFRGKSRILTVEMLGAGVSVGHKDMTRGLFKVWEDIFCVVDEKRRRKQKRGGEHEKDANANRYIHRLLGLISASGEVDKILQGCHENYLRMNIVDTSGSEGKGKIEQALEWLCFHDRVDRFVQVGRDFELARYAPFTVVQFHRLFASVAKPTIEFPRADFDAFVRTRAQENILTSFSKALTPPEYLTWGSRNRILLELLNPFLWIISPDFRAVNVNLLTASESKILTRLVQVMVSFGLRYIQEKGEDGHYGFKLLPAIDNLILGDSPASSGAQLSYQQTQNSNPVKQLIASQVDIEAIRQSNDASKVRGKKAAGGPSSIARQSLFKFPAAAPSTVATDWGEFDEVSSSQRSRTDTTASQVIVPKPIDVKKLKAVPKDFFGRPIIVVDDDDQAQGMNEVETTNFTVVKKKKRAIERKEEPAVTFKFNEGFSNAVRKPMKVSDFM